MLVLGWSQIPLLFLRFLSSTLIVNHLVILALAIGIVAVQGEALEIDYLRRWASELNVLPELEKLLRGEITPKQT